MTRSRESRTHLGRYRQIVTVLVRNGFGLLLDRTGLPRRLGIRRRPAGGSGEAGDGSWIEGHGGDEGSTIGARLRRSCEELGPTFVKIGQLLSTRPDLLPPDILVELQALQDAVAPFPFEEARQLVEEEFGQPLDQAFASFDPVPLASASISQVHAAVLPSGRPVAVKVQRPGVRESIPEDLAILRDLAALLDRHTHLGELYDLSRMVQELEDALLRELDFAQEGANADTFRKNLAHDKGVRVPEIHWVRTTTRVLTMERILGIRPTRPEDLDAAGFDRTLLGQRLATSVANQILRDGFFHTDPHPGNLLVEPDGTWVLLDLGQVGRLSASRRDSLAEMFMGVAAQDSRQVRRAILSLDTHPDRVHLRRFESEIDRILARTLDRPLNEIQVGDLMLDLFGLARTHHIRIPGEFALIAKTLLTLQVVLGQLDESLSVLVLSRPVARELSLQRYGPESLGRRLFRGAREAEDLAAAVPSFLLDALHKLEDDDYAPTVRLHGLESLQSQFARIFNRLSFSIVLLAMAILVAGLIVGSSLAGRTEGSPLWLQPVLLYLGLGVGGLIFLGLLVSFFRPRRRP